MKMNETHTPCQEKDVTKLYKIGMFAGMNHVTIKTLRYYDEQGLLSPAYIDEENGYRYYELAQMAELNQIIALRDMNFSLEEIRALRYGKNERAILLNKKSLLLQEIANLTERLAKVESYLQEEEIDLSAPVIIKSLPKVMCATAKATIQSYDALFDVMPAMGAEMEEQGVVCAEPEYCFTLYLDEGYKEENISVETCQSVTFAGTDTDNLVFKEFDEVPTAACIYHKGSYNDLSKSYAKLLSFIEENGYTISDPVRESYIDGIWNKDNEKEWLTEIQIPVVRR